LISALKKGRGVEIRKISQFGKFALNSIERRGGNRPIESGGTHVLKTKSQ